MDYRSLTEQIIAYTNRNEPNFIKSIPDLINQAMNRIYSDAKTIGFQKTVEGETAPNIPYIDRPIDFKSPINLLYINTNTEAVLLLPRSYEFCIAYCPNENTVGAPVFYSTDQNVPQNNVAQSHIYLAPTPDIRYPYSLTYLSFPPVFNVGNSQNFLTDKYPNLLLYACMVEAIPFLKSDERIAQFENLYSKALQAVNKDTKEGYSDRGTNRDKN